MDVPAIERMRTIRRDSYRCQHREGYRLCLRPASWVVPVDALGDASVDNLRTVCAGHR